MQVGDPGEPISGQLTLKVTQPWPVPMDEKKQAAKQKALDLMERLRARSAGRS